VVAQELVALEDVERVEALVAVVAKARDVGHVGSHSNDHHVQKSSRIDVQQDKVRKYSFRRSFADREVYVCHLKRAAQMPYGVKILRRMSRINSHPFILPHLERLTTRGW